MTKTVTLTVRLKPDIKDALRQAADREHRSLANMLEVMIRDWCKREGIAPLVNHPTMIEHRG